MKVYIEKEAALSELCSECKGITWRWKCPFCNIRKERGMVLTAIIILAVYTVIALLLLCD